MRTRLTSCAIAAACLTLLISPDPALGQRPAKKPAGKVGGASAKGGRATPSDRPATVDRNVPASDRIGLKGDAELLGQVAETSAKGDLIVVARRDWVRANLPDRLAAWEEADRTRSVAAREQRRRRLQAWRKERPSLAAPGDRITPWLDRELAKGPESGASTPLMNILLTKGEVAGVQKRAEQAARAMRAAWRLDLKDAETTPLATLMDTLAGRGEQPGPDEPASLEALLPPAAEAEDRWRLRRAATEALNDDGLRYIRLGNTILPEPSAGQTPDPALAPKLVEGALRDVLSGGRSDPLPERLRSVADRGRTGMIVTRIEVAPDFSSVTSESSLYSLAPGGWDRAAWRTAGVRVGEVPPFVANAVASDPQVRSLLDFIDSIAGGLVSPEMKQRGLSIGASAGGAAIMARSSLTRSLAGIALDLGKPPAAATR